MADLGRIVDLLELRVLHPVPPLEDRVREHVDVLVDRPTDQEPAVLTVVGGDVGSASAEAHAQRRSTEDDAHAASRSSRMLGFCSSQSTVRLIASRMDNVGRHPSERMRSQSRWISGLSPSQPRTPPVYSSSGVTPRWAVIVAIESSTNDGLVGPEVVDRDRPGFQRLFRRELHRRDAVSDVEVRLLLPAVAEHAQARRIAAQASTEVEDVAVRVALAEDRDEAKDDSHEAVPMCVRLDETLPCQLRRAVERRLHRERARLGRGEDLRLSVDRAGRRERDAVDTHGSHRLEQDRGRDRVLLEIPPWLVEPVAHVRVRREVEDRVASLERVPETVFVEDVALHELHALAELHAAAMNSRRPRDRSS